MAYEHNDIVNKTRLMGELGEELMGFEHNDIVTVDVMEKAIAEGGGGGGDFNVANVTVRTGEDQFFSVEAIKDEGGYDYTSIWETEDGFNTSVMRDEGGETIFKLWYHGDSVDVAPYNVVESVTGDAVYDSGTGKVTITGDCTITGYTDD